MGLMYQCCCVLAFRDVDGAELRSCVKVAVDVLGSPSLIFRTVSVDVKQH